MAQPWKQHLEPFAQHFAAMYSLVRELSDEDLKELLDACQQVTQTNCWFCTYDAARFAQPEARLEISMRMERARRAEEARKTQ